MRDAGCLCLFYMLFPMFLTTLRAELAKDEVDRVIEDELTVKLAGDLLQSIERKFQVDLEKSVDMVLTKIKVLLQNGTMTIQDRLVEIQEQLDEMKRDKEKEVETCLSDRQNQTSALAEKALHQMVVCGYALIGHDPAQAVKKVIALKNMINLGLKPLQEQKPEVYDLLRVCGHDHDTLKKVIKCVISKSPPIKSAMMDITSRLIEGVVSLTKLMAHGAMHEACLIEVIKTTEDEAFDLVNEVKSCVYGNSTVVQEEVAKFIAENNATILDIDDKKYPHKKQKTEKKKLKKKKNSDIKDMIRRMIAETDDKFEDADLKKKLEQLHKDLNSNNNLISNDV